MCGIAGVFAPQIDKNTRSSIVKSMCNAMQHRGPDAHGIYSDSEITLGHQRLSIIDVDERSNQPMTDPTGRYVLSFNGEIYNFQQLKSLLTGYRFITSSDTEVVLALYAKFGNSCVEKLKGQFSLAIWDAKDKSLFIARDRLGEKPFFYNLCNGVFLFASELRSLCTSKLIDIDISKRSILDLLVNESIKSPTTIIDNVFQLPPGSYASVKNGTLSVTQYWSAGDASKVFFGETYDTVCNNINSLVTNSVEEQMVSDVPLGAFLSGGIDSSLLVALMSKFSSRPVTTLSVTFESKKFDESPYSREIARLFKTDHHEIKLNNDDLLSDVVNYLDIMDMPSGDGFNSFIVSKAARNIGLTVAISGIGGDELFAGYRPFKWFERYMKYDFFWKLPRESRRFSGFLMNRMRTKESKLSRLISLPHASPIDFYNLVRSCYSVTDAEKIIDQYSPSANEKILLADDESNSQNLLPILSQYSVLELNNYTRNVLLKDTDIASMANSLEVRLPLLDYELVDYVLTIPDEFKYPKTPKKLLLDSFPGLLPMNVSQRKKMGFSFPWADWIRGDLNELCRTSLSSLASRPGFNSNEIEKVWSDFNKQGNDGDWIRLWLLITLEKSLSKFNAPL